MTRPVVLLDMDGPIADFDRWFFYRCRSNGWPMDVTLENQTARFATDHIPSHTHRRRARRMVDTAGWFRELPVTRGAQEGVEALMAEAEVWVCSKPLEANPTCRDDKAWWLAEHFPDLAGRLILAADKSLVAGDVLLDDAPKPLWYDRARWKPVIFSTPWNGPGSAWDGLPRWTWGHPIERLLGAAR